VTSSPLDRLRVFVSSTIKECAQERAVVREAIRSINHEPVLFEDIGARPHPPREVYTARLEISQIFVGIYRESYGWVAPDMNVSGIEDEFRIATDRGMDRLVYVYENPSAREPRLQALIEDAKNSKLTLAWYSDPEQLRDRVRDDLTAVVSTRFVDQAVVSREAPRAIDILDSLLPNRNHRLRRPAIETGLLEALRESSRLIVTGPLGGGKTVLLAQLSVENNWLFVDGQGLNRLDLLARAANALRERLGRRPLTLTTEQSAMQEIQTSWQELPDVTLAVDGATEPMVFWDIAKGHHLVLTSRSAYEVPAEEHFEVPLLSRQEIEIWVTTLRGVHPDPGELSSLVSRSGGNPLYLRFYALGGDSSADLSLRELEIRAVQSLPPRAREITSYLTLSPVPLSLADLNTLVDADEGPEGVAEQISAARALLKQPRDQMQLVHEHLRATLLDQLHHAPTRMAFFASRLARYLEQEERYVPAFQVYCEAGEQRHADRILGRAAHQSRLMGGGAPAVPIFKREIEIARETGHSTQEVYALLNLAHAYKQTGARDDARRALDDARNTANRQGDQALLLRVREMELAIDVTSKARNERIRDLDALRRSYADVGDFFNAARVGTQVAAEYIFGGEYTNAARISREALEVFTDVGDEFGIRIARLNLAAAFSRIDGREQEAVSIARELQSELDPEEFPRARAVLCNLLTRHYRKLGDTASASEFAREAIGIGEHLHDLHVIATNRINLGNVRRDEDAPDQALEEYKAAEQAAVAGGLRDSESAANELIASVLNEREQYRIALHHALHAAALARLVGDNLLIARAEEERATALKGQRDLDGAIKAYTDAAIALVDFRPGESFFVALVGEALDLCISSHRVDLKIDLLSDIFAPDLKAVEGADEVHPLSALYAALPPMAKAIRSDRLLPIVALTMADLLADVPPSVERRIILQSVKALLDSQIELSTNSTLTAIAAILLAYSGEILAIADLVDIAERVARSSPRVYFKPEPDGAAHWTVRLEIAEGIVVSVVQMDDAPLTARTTMILALLLASLGDAMREHLLKSERMPRQEAIIQVASRREFETQLGTEFLNLGEMPKGYAVTESTDVTRSDQPPIFVVCAADFPISWQPNKHALSDMHLLLGEVLRALVVHLLARSVEPEVLFPKIGRLIREIGYRGPADYAHPRVSLDEV
jgi:tetratricopeptide (TPR) repeat protein